MIILIVYPVLFQGLSQWGHPFPGCVCLFVCFLYCRPLGNLQFFAACLHFMEHGQPAGTAPTTQWPAYRRHQPWTHPHHAYHLHQEALWCLRIRTNPVVVAQSDKLQPERMKMGRKESRTGSWQDYQNEVFSHKPWCHDQRDCQMFLSFSVKQNHDLNTGCRIKTPFFNLSRALALTCEKTPYCRHKADDFRLQKATQLALCQELVTALEQQHTILEP